MKSEEGRAPGGEGRRGRGALGRLITLGAEKPGIRRLVIGGLHGREGMVTGPILRRLAKEGDPPSGQLMLVPSVGLTRRHVSTLRGDYYETRLGQRVLALLRHVKPDVYVELHCYRLSAYGALTDPVSRAKRGVPPLVELQDGVLIGPVSPYLLKGFRFEVAILLELPCMKPETGETVLRTLRIVRDGTTAGAILDELCLAYPGGMAKALAFLKAWREKAL